ncbi:MAG: DNA-directed RNA polymerase subunit alpha [Candidatus Moranbacteria bacterium]|nr:DNA-directed RNA polymerase subunit alpha [Candidatus Moranbacteria bacterium]
MLTISLPLKPKYTTIDERSGKFEIMDCHPGYGTTLGNALRRVLLSSLSGAAVTSVKIKGVSHEFSTIPGIMEDVVQIILNIKKVRFKMHGDEPMEVVLKHKGEGKITAGEIKCPSGIEVVNTDQLIATVTDKKTEIDMELEVAGGIGYVPVEQQERKEKEIGAIAIDTVYTPVRRVNYEVENMRVGKRTDYNKITLEIVTDGSITPREAFQKAVQILVDQFSLLLEVETAEEAEMAAGKLEAVSSAKEKTEEVPGEQVIPDDPLRIKVTELKGLSTRTLNILETNKIAKVKNIIKMTEEDLKNLEGMGEKGIKEIKKSIGEFGLTLKQSE